MENFMQNRSLKKPVVSENDEMGSIILELFNSSTTIHLTHLSVTGPGSFAAHKALDSYYNDIIGLADDLAEQYQGVSQKILTYPADKNVLVVVDIETAISYLSSIYKTIDEYQKKCSYSEINNNIDEIKTLINSTIYKLKFLK